MRTAMARLPRAEILNRTVQEDGLVKAEWPKFVNGLSLLNRSTLSNGRSVGPWPRESGTLA